MFSTQRDGVLKEKQIRKESASVELSARKKQILKAIIGDYIRTAEPVGSKALTEGHELPSSLADSSTGTSTS